MQFPSKHTAEEKLAAMRKKAKVALKERENKQQPLRDKTAQLRALRLGRNAEIEVSTEGAPPPKDE